MRDKVNNYSASIKKVLFPRRGGNLLNGISDVGKFLKSESLNKDTAVLEALKAKNAKPVTASVSIIVKYDSDAQVAFDAILAAGVALNSTQKTAWNDYVKKKKADGSWANRPMVLGFIGGTAATHAINLKDGTTKVTWVGGVTHNVSGITVNGTTGYGDINFDATTLPSKNIGFGAYVRTATMAAVMDFGASNAGSPYERYILQSNSQGVSGSVANDVWAGFDANRAYIDQVIYPPDNIVGWLCGNRQSSTSLKAIFNGVSLVENTTLDTAVLPNIHPFIGGINNGGALALNTDRNYAMVQIWHDLTHAQVIADNLDVEVLQDVLLRGVQ